MLDIPEYKELAEEAATLFVQIPASCLCEKGFSDLLLIKTKNRNDILHLDHLMQSCGKFTNCELKMWMILFSLFAYMIEECKYKKTN